MVNQHDANYKAQTFKHVTQVTGLFQFYSAGINFTQDVVFYKTDLIYDTRTWNTIDYKDTILIKNAMINAAPEHNKVGFPEAAFIDIEFDVSEEMLHEQIISSTRPVALPNHRPASHAQGDGRINSRWLPLTTALFSI